MRARKGRLSLVAFCVVLGGCLCAWAQTPEQFSVWGKTAKPDPYLKRMSEPRPAAEVVPTAKEQGDGLVLLSGPAAALTTGAGGATTRCTMLAAADVPGQYGPLTFTAIALRPMEITLTATDLAGPGGQRITAGNLDLRVVRCVSVTEDRKTQTIPLLLEAFDKVTLPAGREQQFWITYYIPDGTPAGHYRGQIVLRDGGVEKTRIPIDIEVYPFHLVEADVDLYMCYDNPESAAKREELARQLADQRLHGMTTSTLTPPVTRPGELRTEDLTALLDVYQQAQFSRPAIPTGLYNRITAEWLNTPDKSIGMWGAWFRYYPFSEKLDRRYVDAVRFIDKQMQSRRLKLILEVADEPGSHAWTTQATQHYNELIREQLPGVTRELTVGGGWAGKRPEDELWKGRINLWTSNRWLPEQFALVRKGDPKAKIGLYNMAGAGSRSGGIEAPRVLYGFYAWKAHADSVSQWCYCATPTPDHNYVWPADNAAPVPTLRWEMIREGAKDRRYVATLESLIRSRTDPAANAARAFLDGLARQVTMGQNEYDAISGGRIPVLAPGTYDHWRSDLADHIRRLTPP